ncbi:MAG: type II secretion system GspH family protein [Lentisphaeria bacterium]|nr:type II secretion system GspH family protein [Lentisphaeria bacterium]
MNKKKSFTMLELIIVIGVIAILVGLSVPAFIKARVEGKNTVAKASMNQIILGITSYEAQYGFLPFYPTYNTEDIWVNSPVDDLYDNLMQTLDGSTTNGLNPRGLSFLELTNGDLKDPWGNDYQVSFDMKNDNKVDASVVAGTSVDLSVDIAVWSKGNDGKHDIAVSDAEENLDNVNSWGNK